MSALARLVVIPLSLLLLSIPPVFALESKPAFSQAELDQMLAPIALYPDALLSQILMAATYPLEIVEAARWSRAHPDLQGEAAVEAVADEDWDPSVKALVAFPQILARMDEDLEWTKRLGDAFLLQEEQVMATVQALRERAYANGHLETLSYLRAYREADAIYIRPAYPHYVYVPYYDPRVIYGPWWWPAYPPVYWLPPPGFFTSVIFFWGSGIFVSPTFFFSTCDWPRRRIVIVHLHKHLHKHHFHHDGKHHFDPDGKHHFQHDGWDDHHHASHDWRHDPKHRRGVAYHDEKLQQEFGRSSASGVVETRIEEKRQWQRDARKERDNFSSGESRRTDKFAGMDDRRSAVMERLRQFDRSEADQQATGKRSLAIRDPDSSTDSEKRTRGAASPVKLPGVRSDGVRSDADSFKARNFDREEDARRSESRSSRTWTLNSGQAATPESGHWQAPARHADKLRALSEKQEALRGSGARSFQSIGTDTGRSAGGNRFSSRGSSVSQSADIGETRAADHRADISPRGAVISRNDDNGSGMSDHRSHTRRGDGGRGQNFSLNDLSTRSSAWTGRGGFSR